MMARCSRQFEKVTDISCLKQKLHSLSKSLDISLIMAVDTFAHKLLGKNMFFCPHDFSR